MKTLDLIRSHRRIALGLSILTLALSLMSLSVYGQVTASGALGGSVVDQNGGVISGATVTATNKATGQTRTATTDDNGEYKNDL
jgi:hypothetical protein